MKSIRKIPVEAYESLLPYGAKTQIAIRAGVSRQSVNSFLHGRTKSKRIEDAILDYLGELKIERDEKLKRAGLL